MVDDGISLRRIEAGRLEQEPVQVGLAVARLHANRRQGFPAGRTQFGGILPSHVEQQPAIVVADDSGLRACRCGRNVDERPPIGGHGHLVVGVLRRQLLQVRAVEVHTVERGEVRVATSLLTHCQEVDLPTLLVDVKHLSHVAVAVRDLVLQRARSQVVEIHLAPVVTLREPQDFVRPGEIAPVLRLVVAALEVGHDLFGHHLANVSARGVGDAQPLLLVIARGGDERQMRAVFVPLHVVPAVPSGTAHVVAQAGAMQVRRHFQAHHSARVNVDNDALNRDHFAVAGQRIRPGLERRMSVRRVAQEHTAHLALVLLEGGNLL